MKRMYPERSYGRFVCMDGLNHEWFTPMLKTFVHYIKAWVWDKPCKLDLTQLLSTPKYPARSDKPVITWLGHSTFLIQVAGKNIVTDPIFGSLSSVFRRLVPPVVKIANLPVIDYVVISHNHFDHMDSASLLAIKDNFPQVKVLVPMGDKDWFDRHLFKNVSEHMWWDEIIDDKINSLKFTFLPANHWTQRTLFDKNKSLWGSWMIQDGDFSIYFGGDTSWGSHFAQIGTEFKNIDVALLPIAPGEPRSWMKDTHIDAAEAVKAFVALRAKMLIPMHWGTFHLGFDTYYQPIELLKQSWNAMGTAVRLKKLNIVRFGQLVTDLSKDFIISGITRSQEIVR